MVAAAQDLGNGFAFKLGRLRVLRMLEQPVRKALFLDRVGIAEHAGQQAHGGVEHGLRGELAAVVRHPNRDAVVIGGEERVPYFYKMDRPRKMLIADDSTLIREFERQRGEISYPGGSGNIDPAALIPTLRARGSISIGTFCRM